MQADPRYLEHVLVNLLSSAQKYSTPETPITISARRHEEMVVVTVTDQGEGIPPEVPPYIFNRFYRAKRGRITEGIVLGLCLTRHLVEAHGGRIWVESEVATGSTFSFTLLYAAINAKRRRSNYSQSSIALHLSSRFGIRPFSLVHSLELENAIYPDFSYMFFTSIECSTIIAAGGHSPAVFSCMPGMHPFSEVEVLYGLESRNRYTKIDFLRNDLGITRITAAKYLDELAEAGFLQKSRLGRANYYINVALFDV